MRLINKYPILRYNKKNYDIGMSNTFKILANSLFGVMITRCEKFKDFKIVTKECIF